MQVLLFLTIKGLIEKCFVSWIVLKAFDDRRLRTLKDVYIYMSLYNINIMFGF